MGENFRHSYEYTYGLFGLTAASDIFFPQLVRADGRPDICISRGVVPLEIESAINKNEFIQISGSELLFRIDGIGRYYVSNGRHIVVEPDSQCSEHQMQLYILGSAMGALLFQRGTLPMHGSAVVIRDRAVIITGNSGAGKSSLTLALREMGHEFLTDDISALTREEDGHFYVQPAYPQQKLWKDSIEAVGDEAGDLTKISGRRDKYYYPAAEGFCSHPVRLGAVCEIVPQEGCDTAELTEVKGVGRIDLLMRNIYRYQLAVYYGSGQAYLMKCAEIANNAEIYRLVRPAGRFTAYEQAERLIERFG